MRKERIVRRLERLKRQSERNTELNTVSLIDIFAILVLYLLVNALVVVVLPSPKALALPESVIQEEPRENPLVLVTREDIFVNNERVMSVAEALATEGKVLGDLKSRLLTAPLQVSGGPENQVVTRGEVNIMADKAIPYQLLKKVMATCTEARYAKISLAVLEKQGGGRP